MDRLDHTKGIPERLLAFERLLEDREDLRHKLSLVQVAVPRRGQAQQYQQLRDQVDQLVGRINGRFTTPGADVPVHYFHRGVSRADLLAYYRLADLMLVTPLKDGMNLVAKEYVTVQGTVATEQQGAMLLSEFTGRPPSCTGLAMRSTRIDRMARRVRRHDIHAWADRELGS